MSLKEIINELVRITGVKEYSLLFQLVKLQSQDNFSAKNNIFYIEDSYIRIELMCDSWVEIEILCLIGDVKIKYYNHCLDSDHDYYKELSDLINKIPTTIAQR